MTFQGCAADLFSEVKEGLFQVRFLALHEILVSSHFSLADVTKAHAERSSNLP